MKKILLSFIVVILAHLHLDAQACAGFYDGFESGTYMPTWQVGTGTYTRTVTTVSPGVGNYSFEQASVGANSFYQGTYTLFAPFQPNYISWYAKTNTTSAANGYMVAGDGNIAADNGIIFCYFNATSGLRFFNTTGYNHPISANTWYHIEARDINYVARHMDIYVDGVLILTDWGFRSPSATTFDRIHLFSLSAATVNYDEFVFGYQAPVINSFSVTNIDCFGNNNGVVDITATAGPINGYLQYSWSNSATTQDISGLNAGNYIVTITDSVGCVTVDSFMVYEPAPLNSSGITTDALCNGDANGTVDLTATGGSLGSGYTYSWSNGFTTEDITNITAGSYTVTITDSAGCTLADTFAVNEPTAINIGAFITDLNCNGDSSGAIDLTTSGGNPGYTYNWNNTATTEDISGLASGNYIVAIADTNGCTHSDTLFVSEPAPVSSSAIVTNDNGTSNGAIDLTASGGTPGYTYLWSNSSTTEDLSGLAAGNYIVTITDNNGCQGFDTLVVYSTAGNVENSELYAKVWPSPFHDVINIQLTSTSVSSSAWIVSDINGKIIANDIISPLETNIQIQVDESLSDGIYFLTIVQEEKRAVIKLVKN